MVENESVNVVAFYMIMLLFFGAVAWFVSGFPGVRRLDDRAAAAVRQLRRRGSELGA